MGKIHILVEHCHNDNASYIVNVVGSLEEAYAEMSDRYQDMKRQWERESEPFKERHIHIGKKYAEAWAKDYEYEEYGLSWRIHTYEEDLRGCWHYR